MGYLGSWLPTSIAVVSIVAMVQQGATAKTAREVNQIAQAITVKVAHTGGNGSGILLQKDSNVYTVLTAAHVVKGKANRKLTIETPDGQQYEVLVGSVRIYAGDVDLAVVKFRSSNNYKLANLGNSNILAGGMDLYVAGFPAPTAVITQSIFVFREGKVTANSKRAFKDGYALLYSNDTLPGMSGGPILNEEGKVVGIHGKGDREQGNGAKTGFNAGIPIARFADIARDLNVQTAVAGTVQSSTLTADDYFVSANQKNRNKDYQGALADYNRAITLNPDYAVAYNNRGVLKQNKLNDPQGALADHNRAITLNPNFAIFYNNRGLLKHENLNDFQGALADYNRSITLNPNDAEAYYNRGTLKHEKLNDFQGALADYNRSIALNPNFAKAYNNRGFLKKKLDDPQGALDDFNKALQINPQYTNVYAARGSLKARQLNDLPGGIADLRQAAHLARAQGQTQLLQSILEALNQLGSAE